MVYKTGIFYLLLCLTLLFGSLQACSQDKNWTHFRGSSLNGTAETENIPLAWDESSIKWKTEIHDLGHSSPVIYGNQIWITTATPEGQELYAMCVDFQTGRIVHDIKVFTPEEAERKHPLNSYATPTPSIEKGFVYVHYGSKGTACINTTDGSIVWKNDDFKCMHVQGAASSPVLYKNLLILHFEGTDVRYLVALDKKDGKLVWRSDRPEEPYEHVTVIGRKAYITPLIVNVKGRDMLISNGSALCQAFDPNNGKEIWRVLGGAESTISMPITEKGIIYWYAGWVAGDNGGKFADLMAVNPDGNGDITGTNIIWKKKHELLQNQMLTPVIKNGLIYTVTTKNLMICVDATTGDEVWSTKVTSNYNASPLYINGNIWFFSVKGEVLVLKEGRKYEEAVKNKMDSGIWATPAALRNSLIIRTQDCLYRIEKQ
jgi:outer membrane protein assembly factor BamB